MLSKPEVKARLLNSGVEVFYTGPSNSTPTSNPSW